MPAKDEKENGDELEHNVVEREEGASDRYHGGPRNATAGELGSRLGRLHEAHGEPSRNWTLIGCASIWRFPMLGQQ